MTSGLNIRLKTNISAQITADLVAKKNRARRSMLRPLPHKLKSPIPNVGNPDNTTPTINNAPIAPKTTAASKHTRANSSKASHSSSNQLLFFKSI